MPNMHLNYLSENARKILDPEYGRKKPAKK